MGDARKTWVIAGLGFVAAVAIVIGFGRVLLGWWIWAIGTWRHRLTHSEGGTSHLILRSRVIVGRWLHAAFRPDRRPFGRENTSSKEVGTYLRDSVQRAAQFENESLSLVLPAGGKRVVFLSIQPRFVPVEQGVAELG